MEPTLDSFPIRQIECSKGRLRIVGYTFAFLRSLYIMSLENGINECIFHIFCLVYFHKKTHDYHLPHMNAGQLIHYIQ